MMAAIGSVVGPLGDWGHVASSTTVYLANGGPHVGRSPLWFFAAVIVMIVVACGVRPGLSRLLHDDARAPRLRHAVGAVAALMLVYAGSSLCRHAPLAIATIALYATAALVWSLVDGTLTGLALGLFVGTVASVGEMVMVALGLFRYGEDISTLAGVAPWLPALHFCFGVAIAVVDRAMAGAPAQTPANHS